MKIFLSIKNTGLQETVNTLWTIFLPLIHMKLKEPIDKKCSIQIMKISQALKSWSETR